MNAARAAFAANWLVARRRHGRAPREGPGRELVVHRPAAVPDHGGSPAGGDRRAAPAGRGQAGGPSARALRIPDGEHPPHDPWPRRPAGRRGGGRRGDSAAIPPSSWRSAGLNLTPSTLFAELHPCGSELKALRSDLRSSESREHGPISRWLRRRLAHANLMRFATPVDPGLVAEVGRLREARFGTVRGARGGAGREPTRSCPPRAPARWAGSRSAERACRSSRDRRLLCPTATAAPRSPGSRSGFGPASVSRGTRRGLALSRSGVDASAVTCAALARRVSRAQPISGRYSQ